MPERLSDRWPGVYAREMEPISTAETSARPAAAPRPAELTAIYLLALVLGATGIFTGLNAATELVGGQTPRPMHLAPEIEQAWSLYREMEAKIAASAAAHRSRQSLFIVAHLAVAAGLLAGAVVGLRAKAVASRLLLAAFCLGVFLELARLMPSIRDARQANQIVEQYAPRMLRAISESGPARGPDGISPPTVALVQAVGKTHQLTIAAATLFKCIFYSIGARYLTRTPPADDRRLSFAPNTTMAT